MGYESVLPGSVQSKLLQFRAVYARRAGNYKQEMVSIPRVLFIRSTFTKLGCGISQTSWVRN